MNVLADSLSCKNQVIGSEWMLCAEVFRYLLRLWPATIDLFATSLNHRLLVYFSPMVVPSVSGHRRHASEFGRPSGLCLPSFRFPFSGCGEGPAVQRVGADVNSSILATASLVPGPFGASGEDSLLPATTEGSSQIAPLPSLSSEPPRASADCLAYL